MLRRYGFAMRESQPRAHGARVDRPSAASAWKPARLQPCKFVIVAQRHKRAVDRLAQRFVLLGKRDPEFLVGRHLERDRQYRTILDQPRDHWMKLDHKTDAPSLEVVEGGRDAVIRLVLDVGDRAFRQ